ncbi:unnamed protein product, partial [Didymodactylos carnosus]
LLQSINKRSHVDFDPQQMKCIHHKFVEQAVNHPQKICVMLDEQSLTYGEVLHRVQYFASYLIRECSVQPGHIICQCVERSIEMVIGILAILSCGACYTPLSPNDPINRTLVLIKDLKSNIVLIHSLTQNKFIDKKNEDNIYFINIQQAICGCQIMCDEKDLNLLSNILVTVDNIAYCLFTSGSTGEPKAVQVCHRSFISGMETVLHLNIMTNIDLVLQLIACSFDVHLLELLGSMTAGATLVMLKREGNLDLNYLMSVIHKKQITFAIFIPTFMLIIEAFLKETEQINHMETLRTICCGGRYDTWKFRLIPAASSFLL